MFKRRFYAGSILASAALALSMLGAASASAAAYHVESVPAFLKGTGEGSQVFTAGAKITCSGKQDTGQMSTVSATSLTLSSVYTSCLFAGQAMTINMNGCAFKLGEPTGTASPFTVKTITIECPAGKEIVITATAAGCTIKFPAQTTTGTSTGTNVGTGTTRSVTIAWNAAGIKYTGSGGICGTSGTSGTYTGKETIKAYKSEKLAEQQGFFIG